MTKMCIIANVIVYMDLWVHILESEALHAHRYREEQPAMRLFPQITIAVTVGILLSGCVTSNPLPFNYQLVGGSATGQVLCGARVCDAGSDGQLFPLNERPYQPQVDTTSNPQSIAAQVVGFTTVRTDGSTPDACDSGTRSPFNASDVKPRGSVTGYSSEYERSIKLGINAKAAADADIESLRAAGLITAQLNVEALKAKIQGTYESLNTRTFKLKARYYTYGLDSDVIREVTHGTKYKSCSDILRDDNKKKLITAAGILLFEAALDEEATSSAAAEIDAQLKSAGVNFSLQASVRRNVSERLKATASSNYQIIAWRLIGAERLSQ